MPQGSPILSSCRYPRWRACTGFCRLRSSSEASGFLQLRSLASAHGFEPGQMSTPFQPASLRSLHRPCHLPLPQLASLRVSRRCPSLAESSGFLPLPPRQSLRVSAAENVGRASRPRPGQCPPFPRRAIRASATCHLQNASVASLRVSAAASSDEPQGFCRCLVGEPHGNRPGQCPPFPRRASGLRALSPAAASVEPQGFCRCLLGEPQGILPAASVPRRLSRLRPGSVPAISPIDGLKSSAWTTIASVKAVSKCGRLRHRCSIVIASGVSS